jgi:hypothetical protein
VGPCRTKISRTNKKNFCARLQGPRRRLSVLSMILFVVTVHMAFNVKGFNDEHMPDGFSCHKQLDGSSLCLDHETNLTRPESPVFACFPQRRYCRFNHGLIDKFSLAFKRAHIPIVVPYHLAISDPQQNCILLGHLARHFLRIKHSNSLPPFLIAYAVDHDNCAYSDLTCPDDTCCIPCAAAAGVLGSVSCTIRGQARSEASWAVRRDLVQTNVMWHS